MGKKPDYEVFVSREIADSNGGDDKNFYTKVGAAWHVNKNGISIVLDALPTDGKLVMFPLRDAR